MLRPGAWCAALGVFIFLTAACAFMGYRLARLSAQFARVHTWIDMVPPWHEGYYDDTTIQGSGPSHKMTHKIIPDRTRGITKGMPLAIPHGTPREITPQRILDHLTTSPKVEITKVTLPNVSIVKMAKAPWYMHQVIKSNTKIPYVSKLFQTSIRTTPYRS